MVARYVITSVNFKTTDTFLHQNDQLGVLCCVDGVSETRPFKKISSNIYHSQMYYI